MNYPPTVYKPCENKCGRCKPCKDFANVLSEINLNDRSKHDLMREAEAELRRER